MQSIASVFWERFISKVAYCMSNGTQNTAHSLTELSVLHGQQCYVIFLFVRCLQNASCCICMLVCVLQGAMWLFVGRQPLLNSYQGSLPSLPVPAL